MSAITKEEYDKLPDTNIRVYVDFSDLSEEEYEAEKKKIFYTTHIRKPKQKTSVKKEIEIPSTKVYKESEKENVNKKMLQVKRKKENVPAEEGSKASGKSNIKSLMRLSQSAPVRVKKPNIHLNDDDMDIDMEDNIPKVIPPTTLLDFPPLAQSAVTIIKSKISSEMMLESNFKYVKVTNLLKNIPLKEAKPHSNKIITLEEDKGESPILLNLSEYPSHINELKSTIPAQYFPKGNNDLLIHCPIDISGINTPRLMYLPKYTPLAQCFPSNKVSFQRYIINYGPGDITHIIIPKTSQIHLPQFTSLTKLRQLLTSNQNEFYDFIQSPGDVVIVQPEHYHYAFVTSDTGLIAVNWSRMGYDINSIESSLDNDDKVPITTTLVKLLNRQMFEMDPTVTKIVMDKLNKTLKERNNIIAVMDVLEKERITKKKQPNGINANTCSHCYNEIFNYYSIVHSSPLCLNCYLNGKEKSNRIIFYKFDDEDINTLYRRMNYLLEKQYQIREQKVNKEEYTIMKSPQDCFDSINGEHIDMSIINKVLYPASDFIFNANKIDDIDSLYRVSKHLLFLADNDCKPIDIFDYDKIVNDDMYIDYELLSGNDNQGRFSPTLMARKFSGEKEEVYPRKIDKKERLSLLAKSTEEKILPIVTHKSNERKVVNNSGDVYSHLGGKSFSSLFKREKKI